ncbi:septum formation initiator family protein, partial [Staphylococcus pseudintermedius]
MAQKTHNIGNQYTSHKNANMHLHERCTKAVQKRISHLGVMLPVVIIVLLSLFVIQVIANHAPSGERRNYEAHSQK